MLTRHPINIEYFSFDNLSIESNPIPPENLEEIKNSLNVGFRIEPHKIDHFRKRIGVKFIINEEEDIFKKSLYRIKGMARLEISLPKELNENQILEIIRISGLHLVVNTLRAYLSQITSSFGWRPFFLPCLNIEKIIEENNFKKILESSPNKGRANKPIKKKAIRSKENRKSQIKAE